jgi:hypothetical protein
LIEGEEERRSIGLWCGFSRSIFVNKIKILKFNYKCFMSVFLRYTFHSSTEYKHCFSPPHNLTCLLEDKGTYQRISMQLLRYTVMLSVKASGIRNPNRLVVISPPYNPKVVEPFGHEI